MRRNRQARAPIVRRREDQRHIGGGLKGGKAHLSWAVLARRASSPLNPLALVGYGRRDYEHAAVGVGFFVHNLSSVEQRPQLYEASWAAPAEHSARSKGHMRKLCGVVLRHSIKLLITHLEVVATAAKSVGNCHSATVVVGGAEPLGRVVDDCLPLGLEGDTVLIKF